MSSLTQPPQESDYPPLVYHYGGSAIPDYALVTLKNVVKMWPAPVYLLHNFSQPPEIRGVIAEDFRAWYSPDQFREVLASTEMDGEFREGFWLHAIERFFVLSQWLEVSGNSRLLHAELDVRLFSHGDLFTRLDEIGPALYMPRASVQQAGANWLYCNDPDALKLVVGEFCRRAGEGYEMQLLARFMDDFPDRVRAVPSHTALENSDPAEVEFPVVDLRDVGMVVDVHPLGTWMLGQDRRNIPHQPVFNHFYYEELGSEKLRNIRYHYSWTNHRLEVCHKGGPRYPLVALHVHSKVMRRAHSPYALALYAWLANQKFDSLVIPQKLGRHLLFLFRAVRDYFYLRVRSALNRNP
jgi:hypothetical protein